MNNANRKIKVLYIQEPAGGGSLIALYEMLKELDAEAIEPVVICYYKNKYTRQLEYIPGCRVIYAEETVPLYITSVFKSSKNRFFNIILIQYNALKKYFEYDKKLVKYFYDVFVREKPDLLHQNNDIVVNRASIRAGIQAHIPQVLHNHGLPFYRFNFVEHIVDSFLLRRIRYHIHLTNAIHDHYKKIFRTPLQNSAVIHSFIDRNIFKPARYTASIKKEFGIEDDEIIIANIGRITFWKGQHVLIEALNIIKSDLPRIKVLMVGSAERGIGSEDYYNHLQKLAHTYELQDKIIFTGDRTDIAEIMNTSDVIVHTAVKPEPQGIVIIEALLCKKMVIASDDAGSAELIKKYGGILFEPGNASQLAKVLGQFFQNKNGNTDIEMKYPSNYKQLDSDFDSPAKAKQIVEIYRRCRRD